ncbi:MAG: molybdopterin-dependent oxidoreductase [Actinomycetota bacterium]
MDTALYDADASDAPTSGPSGDDSSDRPVERPSIWRGLVLGLLATGAGLAVAELIVGLISGASSPVVPVGQEFIDAAPQWLVDWAKETFGTDQKTVLVSGAVIVVFGLGSIIGVLAVRGERGFAYGLTAAIGFIGAWAVFRRPDPDLGKYLPTIVGTIVSFGVLWYLAPRPGPTTDDGRHTMMGPDRRQFIVGAIGIGSAAAMTGGIGRVLQRRNEVDTNFALPGATDVADATVNGEVSGPAVDVVIDRAGSIEGAELGIEGIESFVVPNDDFYRIDTALVVPQVARDSWRLSIAGLVDEPIELTYDDLLSRPQVERYVTLSCVSNPVGGDLVGNALWQGVLIKDILDEVGLQPGAEQLVSRSVDGWTCGTPVEAVTDGRDAMLAFGMNGEPLPAQHGFPVRMVVPGLFGYVSATKWVTDWRLTRWEDFDAYWVPRGWSKRGPVKTMARIDTPRSGRDASGTVSVGGVAWAVHRGVSAVQVRFDEGEWLDCELASVPSADTWVQWKYDWDTSSLPGGRYAIEVRAIDGDGEPQPQEPKPVAPDGAQGYHRIVLSV